jgi:hypothetical protein
MFASMWLTKISCVCKPCKIIPFLFVGAMAMRVAGNKEVNGEGGKGDGDRDKDVRRGMALATKWATVTSTRVAGEEESKDSKAYGGNDEVAGDQECNGEGGKGDGDCEKMAGKRRGQWQLRRRQHGRWPR